DVQLFISMDGADAATFESIRRRGRFALVMENIERLAVLTRRPFIIFTLQEDNFDQLVPMAELAVEHRMHLLVNTVRRDEGIEPFVAMVRDGLAGLREDYAQVLARFEDTGLMVHLPDRIHGIAVREGDVTRTYGGRTRCPAIDTELCVHFDGAVSPCNMFNPFEYGNLLEMPLAEIRNGKKATWFRENHKEHYYCQNCACLGGTA
ncbi:MAG: sulfatase maturation enzyme AslB (radical SAM superfamily), partial [Myxococcota bacterium]